MSFFTVGAIAVGLAMDAFAVAVAASVSLKRVSPRQVFRFAFHFGLFQALMPLLGWGLGRFVADAIETWDHWVAFALLSFIGARAIYGSFTDAPDEETAAKDPTRGWSLVMFSLATSIDAMAVGLSLAMLRVDMWYSCLVIGVVTATLTTFGMLYGPVLGKRLGPRVEVVGGIILIGIGVKILIAHMTG